MAKEDEFLRQNGLSENDSVKGREVSRSDFPPDFVFGVATSAYQVRWSHGAHMPSLSVNAPRTTHRANFVILLSALSVESDQDLFYFISFFTENVDVSMPWFLVLVLFLCDDFNFPANLSWLFFSQCEWSGSLVVVLDWCFSSSSSSFLGLNYSAGSILFLTKIKLNESFWFKIC